MEKLTRVLIAIFLLSIVFYFIYSNKNDELPVSRYNEKSSNVVVDTNNTVSSEVELIRNRPFPLAGMGNDAGMETGDEIAPRNKEPILETYSVGTTLTTRHGVKVDTKFYNAGNQITEGYGYSQYNPSPKTNGLYNNTKITFENFNKIPFELNVENIILIDQEKKQYYPIKQTKDCGFEKTEATETDNISGLLNPNVPCTVNLLFEVAPSTNSFHVQFDIN